MAAVEKVYALHDFDAENPDEVSFKAGEAVIIVEKDDAYGDGWWQGTNLRGETGLFPFSYTTFDAEAAKGSAAAAAAGNGALASGAAATGGQGMTGANGKVMNSTMADIDEALAGLRTGNGSGPAKGISADRRSVDSERTGDYSMGDTDENGGNAEDDLQARAKARAALAVNAAKDQEETDEAEREEQLRMKAQAQRIFEEEEEKQRQLLLKREEERKVAAAQGILPESDKVKVAPIAGLDMSDDSDSEGSEGPDFDDGVAAPTHAPLFGGPAAASSANSGTPIASEALRSVGASPAPASSAGATPKDASIASLEQQQQISQPGRSLSPIPSSVGAHSQGGVAGADQTALFAGASAAAAAGIAAGSYAGSRQSASGPKANTSVISGPGQAAPDSVASYDQRSISSSKGRTSTVADSTATGAYGSAGPGNGTSVGTAPTSVVGTETPKSQHTAAAQQSPSPSVAGSRQHHAAPRGDPRDWTVEDVVAWGRSKGWDEAQVVSKFAEHEISGDVLLEMDINILKEIDINAFGKRFQVSNAIKELNKSLQGGSAVEASPMAGWPGTPDGSSGPGAAAAGGVFHQQQQQQQPPQQRGYNLSSDSPSVPPQNFTVPGRASSTSQPISPPSHLHSGPPTANSPYFDIVQPSSDTEAMGGPAAPSGWTQSPMIGSQSQDRDLARMEGESVSALRSEGRRSSQRTTSEDASLNNVLVGVNPAARKRESAGSGSGKVSGDRSSFFAGFHGQKGRKPAPRVQSQTPTESSDGSKGTFSRLGFNRLKAGGTTPNEVGTPTSDLRNKISLPTSSPTYDAMGDTARRTRASQLSSGGSAGGTQGNGGLSRGGGPAGPGYMGHQKQASVGSAGQNAADWHSPASAGGQQTTPGGGQAEGPVMLRIRPVDREGWMRKKGERYNSWKPRYLALKGSDLVLLRDPSAAKIKGYVSMKGYKVIADENTNPGKYGFKILHETEKPHYFSSDDSIVVREWMKALMKATIDRDTSLPVISSYNNATISLKEAQRMNPPPRPPSPTSRARAQRATARANKDQLTAKDASVLMGLHQSGDARQKGFLIQERVGPSYECQDQQVQLQKEARRILQSKKQAFSQYRYTRSQDEGPARFAGTIGHAPETRANSTIKRVAVAPLMTLDLAYDTDDLPELERGQNEDQLGESFERGVGRHFTVFVRPSPPPPPPLPKSTIASCYAAGVTSLSSLVPQSPPPAPPSHSPEHESKLYKFRLRLGSSRAGRSSAPSITSTGGSVQNPWYGDSGSASMLLPPTPLSKGLSQGSGSTYPTLSPRSADPSQSGQAFDGSRAAQSTASASSKIPLKPSRRSAFLHRPKSAGVGMIRSRVSSSASHTFSRTFASSAAVDVTASNVDRDSIINFKEMAAAPRGNGDGTFGQRGHRERALSESSSTPLSAGSLTDPTSVSRACQGKEVEEASSILSGESFVTEEKRAVIGQSFSAGSADSAGYLTFHHRPIVASPLSGQFAVTADQSHGGHIRLRPAPERRGRRQTDIESDEKIAQAEEEIEREELHTHRKEQREGWPMEGGVGEGEEEEEEERLRAFFPSSAVAQPDMTGTFNNPTDGSLTQQNLSPTPLLLPPSPTPPPVVSKI